MSKNGKIRINFDLTKEANKQLLDLKKRAGFSTVAELFRKAVALQDLVTTHLENGGKIQLVYESGRTETLKIL